MDPTADNEIMASEGYKAAAAVYDAALASQPRSVPPQRWGVEDDITVYANGDGEAADTRG